MIESKTIEKARELGMAAYHSDLKRIPLFDKEMMDMVSNLKGGAGADLLLMAWLNGWDYCLLSEAEVSR